MKVGNYHRRKTKESVFLKNFRENKEKYILERAIKREKKKLLREYLILTLKEKLKKELKLKYGKYHERKKEKRRARNEAKKFKKDFCFVCGSKEKLHLHHVDRNIFNIQESNIQTLCVYCHFKAHKGDKQIERLFKTKYPNINFDNI